MDPIKVREVTDYDLVDSSDSADDVGAILRDRAQHDHSEWSQPKSENDYVREPLYHC